MHIEELEKYIKLGLDVRQLATTFVLTVKDKLVGEYVTKVAYALYENVSPDEIRQLAVPLSNKVDQEYQKQLPELVDLVDWRRMRVRSTRTHKYSKTRCIELE